MGEAEKEEAEKEANEPLPGPRSAKPHLSVVPPPVSSAEDHPPAASENPFLREELRTVRDELARLEELLEQLPTIYEAKFRQRLRALLSEQRVLEARNRALEQELFSLTSPPPSRHPNRRFGAPRIRALLAPLLRR